MVSGYKAQDVQQGRAPLPTGVRTDRWWIEPALVVATLGAFSVYAIWRALEGNYYDGVQALQHGAAQAPAYLSPFYSPPIHEWFPDFRARFFISPAFFVLVFPLSFRATCYYCRRSYYRAFFWDPPACSMPEPGMPRRKAYTGENAWPFLLQNLHRYALYAILVVVAFHYRHLYDACFMVDAGGVRHVGIGLGTLVMALDTVLLSLYVFSCHSWRHLIGGGLNRLSSAPVRLSIWRAVSALNARHGLYFWLSLITVGLADLYVRLVASGMFVDPRII
jgi:hypothetical protein